MSVYTSVLIMTACAVSGFFIGSIGVDLGWHWSSTLILSGLFCFALSALLTSLADKNPKP